MSNNYFRFKQFTVWQDRTAMKVGTDGVLVGTLAESSAQSARILDIGTGTGVVALIVAQRFPSAFVDAVEIDIDAFTQATYNFSVSPFSNRIKSYCADILEFDNKYQYDLIVSNPPYFVNSLKNPDNQRAIARHNITLTFDSLCASASRLLSLNGTFAVVVPTESVNDFLKSSHSCNLFEYSRIDIKTTPRKLPKRTILNFRFEKQTIENKREIIIEKSPLEYTEEFYSLIKDFYLDR